MLYLSQKASNSQKQAVYLNGNETSSSTQIPAQEASNQSSATTAASIEQSNNQLYDMHNKSMDLLAQENNNNHIAGDASCANDEKQQLPARQMRSIEQLTALVKNGNFDPSSLTNEEIIELMLLRKVSVYKLESILGRSNARRCVEIRRLYYTRELELLDKLDSELNKQNSNLHRQDEPCDYMQEQPQQTHMKSSTTHIANLNSIRPPRASILRLPQTNEFDYSQVVGACCENVVGCVRLPVGIVGPLKLDNQIVYVPLATTEGCLVASTSRGLSALYKSGGVMSQVTRDGMTRAPIVRFQDSNYWDAVNNVTKAISWLQDSANKAKIQAAFRSNSRHTNLINYTLHRHGRDLHIRFVAQTGDAMGMNMCSKGAEAALKEMQRVFPTMDILTISGNLCTDKKPSAMNWTHGRGKSVECNALIPAEIVESVFKVAVDSLIEVWLKKVMIGSAMAGSIGGFNCHAANIVAAIFIATGQDAAQVVSSSNCIITLEKESCGSLAVHCSMPSIECGTVGGGTLLSDQSGYLQLMGIKGSTPLSTGSSGSSSSIGETTCCDTDAINDTNARKLARIICSTVMAAELSLLASLTEGTLVKSHMTHNRSAQPCKVV